MVSCCLY